MKIIDKIHNDRLEIVKALLHGKYCDLCSWYDEKHSECEFAKERINSYTKPIKSKYNCCKNFNKKPDKYFTEDEFQALLYASSKR